MSYKTYLIVIFIQCIFLVNHISAVAFPECPITTLNTIKRNVITQSIIPSMEQKLKGEAGIIGIIGGSNEDTGAPYLTALSALRLGADEVYVVTTKEAAPVIRSYSPDILVYPYLHTEAINKTMNLLLNTDVVIIGPGLGKELETITFTRNIIDMCKTLEKPLVIDADGLQFVILNSTSIKEYPNPGIILTPNQHEAYDLQQSVGFSSSWYKYWGDNVSVLTKGQSDQYNCASPGFEWNMSAGGTGRRVSGQGHVLSGFLGTFFSWVLKYQDFCDKDEHNQLARSISAYGAAKLTRACNFEASKLYGRSWTASDMVAQVHVAFNIFSYEGYKDDPLE